MEFSITPSQEARMASMTDVLWIARTSTEGPVTLHTGHDAVRLREKGWTVEGPYYHQSRMLPSCVECPECGSEVDTRTARAL